MSGQTSYPIPEGRTVSFTNLLANISTPNFYIGPGQGVITFQPVDVNNPGVLTLYDSNNNVIATMNMVGYGVFYVGGEAHVPGAGGSYYFSCTKNANLAAATTTTVWR